MDEKDLRIQKLRAENKKLKEELDQMKNQPAAADMDKLTTEMMEHICDNLCKHPNRVGITQDELENICAECKMGKFVCDILNAYNRQAKQLTELKESELDPIEMCKVAIALDKLKEYQRLEEQGLLLHLPCAIGSTIYQIAKVRSTHWEEEKIIVDDEGEWKVYERLFKPVIIPDVLTELGKKIFLTEQEAQSALEKMKGI